MDGKQISELYRKEGVEGLYKYMGATREELAQMEKEGMVPGGVLFGGEGEKEGMGEKVERGDD